MSRVLSFPKKLLFWSYGRSTWQYDVLCVAILALIFLTPRAWWENGELRRPGAHLNAYTAANRLLIPSENLPATPGTGDFERRAREATGRSNVRVKGAQPLRDEAGRVVAYEVDIE